MKTILYNSATQQVISPIYQDGYKVDGQPQSVEPPIYELEYIETTQPEHDPVTQYVTQEFLPDFDENEYRQVWYVHDRTDFEIAMQDWAYPEFQKRIVAPDALLLDDVGSKVFNWFTGKGLPFENCGDNIRLYFNDVLPQHQALVAQFDQIITIESRPRE